MGGNDQVQKGERKHKMPFSKEADTHNFYFNRFSLLNTLQGPLPLFDVKVFLTHRNQTFTVCTTSN